MVGYHLANITKGEFGEASKVIEEVDEFIDAINQGSSVMALVELSDLVGAIRGYLTKHHPSVKIEDLIIMSKITERAFLNGHRD